MRHVDRRAEGPAGRARGAERWISGGCLVLGIIWLSWINGCKGAARQARAARPPRRRRRADRRSQRRDSVRASEPDRSGKGARLERLLARAGAEPRGTWRSRPTAGPAELPAPTRAEEEDVEERESLEETRAGRKPGDRRRPAASARSTTRTTEAEAIVQRRIEAARGRDRAPGTRLTTRHSIERSAQEPADHTRGHGGTRSRSCGTRSSGGRFWDRRCRER